MYAGGEILRSASCIIDIERVGERGTDKPEDRGVEVMVVVITVFGPLVC
jgi:hypothetical protein